ncbi:Ubiquitin-like superfamily protein [Perilla frutescens var. frutescens]|nr:Ubiquitin-like superfamily protein [Perilla frutescens var. frutescens]
MMQILESGNDHCKPRFSNGSMMCLFPPMPNVGSPRRSFSYNRLQPPPLCLTVLKLDGSSFGVEVSEMGTVGELKRGVEAAFDHLPKEGPGRISWEHVWGQFCLCHEGEMLLTDRDYISMLGIKDGDQLQFTHRASSTNNFRKIKSKGADTSEDDEPHKTVGHKNSDHDEEILEDNHDVHWDLEDDDGVSQREHRSSLFLKGWFPYRKFSSSGSRLRLGERGCSSRSSRNVLVSFKNCLRFSGHKYEPRRLNWKIK